MSSNICLDINHRMLEIFTTFYDQNFYTLIQQQIFYIRALIEFK